MSTEVEIIPPSLQPGITVQWTPLGPPAPGGGGDASFLPTPSHVDDTDPTYFFLGWSTVQLIRRTVRSTDTHSQVTVTGDFTTSWNNRASLIYP